MRPARGKLDRFTFSLEYSIRQLLREEIHLSPADLGNSRNFAFSKPAPDTRRCHDALVKRAHRQVPYVNIQR